MGDGDDPEDDGQEGLHQASMLRMSKLWMRRSAFITAAFIAATLVVRWYHDRSERSAAESMIGGASAASAAAADAKVEYIIDDGGDVRGSCGEYFEPDPIMALKNASTAENLENGAVASDNLICSRVGTSVMRDSGGNAVDAAVAAALCLGVVNPASSGLGGGAFILIHSDEGHHVDRAGGMDYRPPPFDDLRGGGGVVGVGTAAAAAATSAGVWGDGPDGAGAGGGPPAPEDEPGGGRAGRRRRRGKITEVIDCRETAPSSSAYDMFAGLPEEASRTGGLSIAVPGELRGLELAHSRHGSMPWWDVVRPAMELARDGFLVSRHLARDIRNNRVDIMKFKDLARMLSRNGDGRTLVVEGDTLTLPELADTLRLVMRYGSDAVYAGEVAKTIARDARRAGGILTAEDMRSYRPAVRDPLIAADVGGFTLVGVPPPSSGGAAVIGAARFLSGYPDPLSSFADTLSKHRIVEASKHAFAVRMSLADPEFDTNATEEAVADLVRGPYMEGLRRMTLDGGVLPLSRYGGERWSRIEDRDGDGELVDAHEGDRRLGGGRPFGYLNDHGTTHLSVVDRDRNAVSMTSTVNIYFGSKVVSPSTGIILNDQMDDFATPGRTDYFGLRPSPSNYIAPGKRPLSSMSPTLIFRRDRDETPPPAAATDRPPPDDLGTFFMSLGSSGGPKIITSVLQVFLNYAVLGMPLYESVSDPRVHDQLLYHGTSATGWDSCPLLQGPTIEVPVRTRAALARRGHRLLPTDYLGTTQAVAADLETGRLTAVSDVRKDGCPAGY